MMLGRLPPPFHRSRSRLRNLSSSSGIPRVTTHTGNDGICEVVLNRPDKLNSCDMNMFHAIAQTASSLREDRSVRVVILRGEGRAFCTGLDVKSVMNSSPLKQIDALLKRPSGYGIANNEIGNLAQDVSYLWRELPVPVICVIHGMCYGAGLQIALGADFRYATPDCQLSVMETKWGLIPDMSIAITLRELVRIDVAKELTMTGRIVAGTEAAALGLVTKVCENPLDDAREFAKELVKRSPDALACAKDLYQSTWTAATEKECLDMESKLQRKLLVSWNQLASSGRAFGYQVPFLNRKDQ
jgi:enoyl-CoA hydratase/carnithine racemase